MTFDIIAILVIGAYLITSEICDAIIVSKTGKMKGEKENE